MKAFIMVLSVIIGIILDILCAVIIVTFYNWPDVIMLSVAVICGGVIGFGCSRTAIAIIEGMDDYYD